MYSSFIGSAASPGDVINLRFQSTSGSSNKFIDMTYNGGPTFTATWGKQGTAGKQTDYPVSEWDSYYKKKVKKGYTDVTGGGGVNPVYVPPTKKKAAPATPAAPIQKVVAPLAKAPVAPPPAGLQKVARKTPARNLNTYVEVNVSVGEFSFQGVVRL
jgi:predicted DNA-binding WGR domain protein